MTQPFILQKILTYFCVNEWRIWHYSLCLFARSLRYFRDFSVKYALKYIPIKKNIYFLMLRALLFTFNITSSIHILHCLVSLVS